MTQDFPCLEKPQDYHDTLTGDSSQDYREYLAVHIVDKKRTDEKNERDGESHDFP